MVCGMVLLALTIGCTLLLLLHTEQELVTFNATDQDQARIAPLLWTGASAP